MHKPLIGLIVPPPEPFLPPDAPRLWGGRCQFTVEGLGIDEMSEEGFAGAPGRVAAAAARLGARGAAAIAMLGTSLSFFRGAAYNASLEHAMREASGRPAVSATSAVVAALRAAGAHRVAVGTAYERSLNDRLRDYLGREGFDVPSVEAMNIRKVREAIGVTEDALLALARRAHASCPGAQAIFVSCGAFAMAGVTERIEAECGLPVVASTPAALAAAAALASVP